MVAGMLAPVLRAVQVLASLVLVISLPSYDLCWLRGWFYRLRDC
jgi:hypothetical protein